MIPDSILRQIESKVDIVELVSNFIDVQRAGRTIKSICPFHDDDNPSMHIHPEKKIYNCFSCGAKGGMFKFVMDYKNISFPEAVKYCADFANIDISPHYSHSVKKVDQKALKYYEINRAALDFFILTLKSNEGVSAMKYLKSRKLTDDDVKKYQIGFSTFQDKLTNYLTKKGFESKLIISAGLGYLNEETLSLQDQFKGRIIFPLIDENQNVVGFSGRSLIDNKKYPKYKNTQETYVFNKSNYLYNINNAVTEIRKTKKIYLCEGFTDVIALEKIGIKNAVAIMGTAFNDIHLKNVRKIAKDVTLILDGDDAGLNAALKSLEVLNKSDLLRYVVPLGRGKDIDDMYQNNEVSELKMRIEKRLPWYKFETQLIKHQSKGDMISAIKKMVQRIGYIGDELEREVYIAEIEKITNVPRSSFGIKEIEKKWNDESVEPTQTINSYKENRDRYNALNHQQRIYDREIAIMTMLIGDSKALEIFTNSSYRFTNETLGVIIDYVKVYKPLSINALSSQIKGNKNAIINKVLLDIESVSDKYNNENKYANLKSILDKLNTRR